MHDTKEPRVHDPRGTLLTPRQVASRFHVSPKTVAKWAEAGHLTAVRTLGGHRRYWSTEIDRVVAEHTDPAERPR